MIRKYITNVVVIAIVTVGVIAIAGWFSDIEKIRPVLASIASTKFNTAICLILSAVALYASNRQHKPPLLRKIGVGCAWGVVIIAALTLLEYITGIKLGIDQAIVNDLGAEANPGRIEVFACLLFLKVGIILIHLQRPKGN